MIHRRPLPPPEHIYPIDDWRMIEKGFHPRFLAQNETIFSVGNGYLGLRGTMDEGRPVAQHGTFVNGFHETWPIVYGERAYGFAKNGQTMLHITDAKIIRLYVDDEPLFLPVADLLAYERVLDMRAGTLDRHLQWETPGGKQVLVTTRRLVSLEHRHLAAISYEVTVLNAAAPVVLQSDVVANLAQSDAQPDEDDPRKAPRFGRRVLKADLHRLEDQRIVLGHHTERSGMTLGCVVDHVFETECPFRTSEEISEDEGRVVYTVDAQPGQPIRLIKFMGYHSSRRSAPPRELCKRSTRTVDRAMELGFEGLLESQRRYVDEFWNRSDIEIECDRPRAQQCLRFNLFHLLQASARAEGNGIGARGLTGQAYEGQYFWDLEVYVLPFLVYTSPRIARNLLRFRYTHLEKARQRAEEVNQKGAMYPWRTINGEEASAYYAAGTAQYHINADIMYALRKYVEATGDDEFLFKYGAEMLIETARLWVDLGHHDDDGRFHIHGVTGPDEYNTVVNDNAFTNLMARANLRFAAETIDRMRDDHPRRYAGLAHRTGLAEEEVGAWKRAADSMYVPFDEARGINPQDSTFLDKKPWDFEGTPREKYPLLLNYHPLVIYRHKVIKQADIVLAMFLLNREFSPEQKRRNFDYYDPLTTGDSSLSACIQSIVAWELGYYEKAWEYLWFAALTDLSNTGGNVSDGAHLASIGGTWMAVVHGIAGMRDTGGELAFHPHTWRGLKRLRFPVCWRSQRIDVELGPESVSYSLRAGAEVTIRHRDQRVELTAGTPVTFPLK